MLHYASPSETESAFPSAVQFCISALGTGDVGSGRVGFVGRIDLLRCVCAKGNGEPENVLLHGGLLGNMVVTIC